MFSDGSLFLGARVRAMPEGLRWLDALMAETAIRNRCTAVQCSEDGNHGGRIGNPQLINPLRD